jgi:hypothetical protein
MMCARAFGPGESSASPERFSCRGGNGCDFLSEDHWGSGASISPPPFSAAFCKGVFERPLHNAELAENAELQQMRPPLVESLKPTAVRKQPARPPVIKVSEDSDRWRRIWQKTALLGMEQWLPFGVET